MKKFELFKKLSNCNDYVISNIVNVNMFKNEYSSLKLGNGGSWCRFDSKVAKKYKLMTYNEFGKLRCSWEADNYEISKLNNEIKKLGVDFYNKNSILFIKLCGFQNLDCINRSVRSDIKNIIQSLPCVHCGTTSNIEVDHKNGLYNDKRVLNINTQRLEDFQPLCKHCNDLKRQTIKEMKNTGIRYPATKIPIIRKLGIKYTQGNENYDINDPNTMIGTYWYDPVDFISRCLQK